MRQRLFANPRFATSDSLIGYVPEIARTVAENETSKNLAKPT